MLTETRSPITRTEVGHFLFGWTSSPVAAAIVGLALAALGPAEVSAQSIVSFGLDPAAPTTGDRVSLSAMVFLPEDCGWQSAGTIRFGLQDELGPAAGWGLGLDLARTVGACLPVLLTLPIQVDLGTLPVASAPGVLRLRVDGRVADTRLFNLEVAAGPAPGWGEPAFHGGFERLTYCTALTSVPGRLAMSDLLNRAILLVDPKDGTLLSYFDSPGSGDVRGLAFDGHDLFVSVSDAFGPRIYKVDLLGRVLDAFPSPTVSPGAQPLEGLAFLRGILYGTYQSPPILFAIDPVTHRKIWERSLPARILGLDAAPEGLLGVEPSGTLYLIEATPNGEDVVLADPADHGLPGVPELVGLAYDGAGITTWDQSRTEARFFRTLALWWAVDGSLRAYLPDGGQSVDVIRGDVADIQQLSAEVGLGPTTCLVADGPGEIVPAGEDPPPGHAYFYMVRFHAADGFDTSYGRSFPLGFRRIDLADTCP